jgi:aminoglycoside phosphotransferase
MRSTARSAAFTRSDAESILDLACRRVGIESQGARFLRLGENALFLLSSCPAVVRIARGPDYWSDVTKEVAVSVWLETVGFPGARTYKVGADQPISVDGHPVTFWQYIPGAPASREDIGQLAELLKQLHSLPPPTDFDLPAVDMMGRVESRIRRAPIPNEDKDFLFERCEQIQQDLGGLPFVRPSTAIHGDAHIKNVMAADGVPPTLIDFERFAWGHPELDLSVTATEYAVAGWWTHTEYETFADAYGFDVAGWPGFATVRDANAIKMTTWIMQNVGESAEIADEYARRMQTIRSGEPSRDWTPF